MLVLGFQEIVPLTAQQIVQTDPEKRSDIRLFPIQIFLTFRFEGNCGREF